MPSASRVEIADDLERVVRTLNQIVDWRGKPASIRCDNGPEYQSRAITEWANAKQIKLAYIQPRQPQQNAYIELLDRKSLRAFPVKTMPHFLGSSSMLEPNLKD